MNTFDDMSEEELLEEMELIISRFKDIFLTQRTLQMQQMSKHIAEQAEKIVDLGTRLKEKEAKP